MAVLGGRLPWLEGPGGHGHIAHPVQSEDPPVIPEPIEGLQVPVFALSHEARRFHLALGESSVGTLVAEAHQGMVALRDGQM